MTPPAPFYGYLQNDGLENYQRVNSGEGIVRLVNTQKLRIKFTVPEDIPLVRPVKTAPVSSQSVILKDFSGMVEAVEYVKLAFRVSGQIIDLPVVEGQRVRKGQLIAAIDPRDISLQYAADKAAYETAAAQVERNKRLLGRQAISLQEYEISVANYQKAKSAYELSTGAAIRSK